MTKDDVLREYAAAVRGLTVRDAYRLAATAFRPNASDCWYYGEQQKLMARHNEGVRD